MLLAWDERYRVGIPEVDYEHQELIRLVNETYERLTPVPDPKAVAAVLGEIHDRVSAHFALEEKHMRQERYNGLPAHKADHERLLEEIRDIMDEVEEGVPFEERAFAERLANWFSEHFRTHDAVWHHHRQDAEAGP
jgi:hemerythrin-like metal-binding protein